MTYLVTYVMTYSDSDILSHSDMFCINSQLVMPAFVAIVYKPERSQFQIL